MSDANLNCLDSIWMGISDIQQEGEFLNISRHTYDDVFVYDAKVGVKLLEERWMENQPGGGVTENCVTTTRDSEPGKSWKDEVCEGSHCVACTIKANQFYTLRGLCKNTEFDVKYKIKGNVSAESRKHEFIGEYGWEIKWFNDVNGFLLSSSDKPDVTAIYNDTQEYPLGLKKVNDFQYFMIYKQIIYRYLSSGLSIMTIAPH